MNEHHRSQILLIPLIICLCVVSLIALPAGDYVGGLVKESIETGTEDGDLFDPGESEEEFYLASLDSTTEERLPLKSLASQLGVQNPPLFPVTPPPKFG